MMWVVSLAVRRNVECQRWEHKLWGISHWAFPAGGGTAACLVPRVIQQEMSSGRSMGAVVLLLLGRSSKLFLVQRLIGLDLTGLRMRSEVKVLFFYCCGQRAVKEAEGTSFNCNKKKHCFEFHGINLGSLLPIIWRSNIA